MQTMRVRLLIDVNVREAVPGKNKFEAADELKEALTRTLNQSSLVASFSVDSLDPEAVLSFGGEPAGEMTVAPISD